MTFARGLPARHPAPGSGRGDDRRNPRPGNRRDRRASLADRSPGAVHLHTNTAIGAITRLVDKGIEPFLLSSSLLGVLAQRLVR